MRTIPATLQTAINQGKICNLIKLTRKDGEIFTFTDHDRDIVIGSITYKPAPGLTRLRLQVNSNRKISSQELSSGFVLGDFTEDDLKIGLFDNAQLEAFKIGWDDPTQATLLFFSGNLGIVRWTDEGWKADFQSFDKKLNRNIGVTTTGSCRHRLFDLDSVSKVGACNLARAAFTFNGTVDAIITQRITFEVTLSNVQTDNYYAFGELTWTSGNNNAINSEIGKYTTLPNSKIELMLQTPKDIQVGDTFDITAGCNKSLSTCKNKFDNVINFGGFPDIQTEVQFR